MNTEPFNVIRLLMLVLLTYLLLNFLSCTKYPAQKTPFPVGTKVYLHDITLDCVQPLTIQEYSFDDFDKYDGSYHFFYSVTDMNGKEFTHVIDYQLRK